MDTAKAALEAEVARQMEKAARGETLTEADARILASLQDQVYGR